MTVDPTILPGLLLLGLELAGLAAAGFVVARVALRQADDGIALAQGMVIGPALWGLLANFVLYLLPGRAGALASWVVLLALGTVLVWRAPGPVRPRLRSLGVFVAAALALFWGHAGRPPTPADSRRSHPPGAVGLHPGRRLAAGGFLDPRPAAPLSLWRGHADRAPDAAWRARSPLHHRADRGVCVDRVGPRHSHAAAPAGRLDQRGGAGAAAAHPRRLDTPWLHHSAARHPADSRSDRLARGRPWLLARQRVLARGVPELANRVCGDAAECLETPVRVGLRAHGGCGNDSRRFSRPVLDGGADLGRIGWIRRATQRGSRTGHPGLLDRPGSGPRCAADPDSRRSSCAVASRRRGARML